MNDYEKLTNLLQKLDIPYKIFDEEKYIDDKSVKAGAVISVSIRDSAHINFDINGYCVSSSTDSINSTILTSSTKQIIKRIKTS